MPCHPRVAYDRLVTVKGVAEIKGSGGGLGGNAISIHAPSHIAPPANNRTALQVVAVGGEPCSAALVKRWTARPGLRLLNLYGTTEGCGCRTPAITDHSSTNHPPAALNLKPSNHELPQNMHSLAHPRHASSSGTTLDCKNDFLFVLTTLSPSPGRACHPVHILPALLPHLPRYQAYGELTAAAAGRTAAARTVDRPLHPATALLGLPVDADGGPSAADEPCADESCMAVVPVAEIAAGVLFELVLCGPQVGLGYTTDPPKDGTADIPKAVDECADVAAHVPPLGLTCNATARDAAGGDAAAPAAASAAAVTTATGRALPLGPAARAQADESLAQDCYIHHPRYSFPPFFPSCLSPRRSPPLAVQRAPVHRIFVCFRALYELGGVR